MNETFCKNCYRQDIYSSFWRRWLVLVYEQWPREKQDANWRTDARGQPFSYLTSHLWKEKKSSSVSSTSNFLLLLFLLLFSSLKRKIFANSTYQLLLLLLLLFFLLLLLFHFNNKNQWRKKITFVLHSSNIYIYI